MNSKPFICQLLILLFTLVVAGCTPPSQETIRAIPTAEALNLKPESTDAQSSEPEPSEQETVLDLPQNIDIHTVASLQGRSDVFFLDVREQWEYDLAHIPDITLIPMGTITERISEIPQDKTVVVVCHSGGRSNRITNFLRDSGFTNVHNMQGGMVSWAQAGYDVEQ